MFDIKLIRKDPKAFDTALKRLGHEAVATIKKYDKDEDETISKGLTRWDNIYKYFDVERPE